ncbi:carotenoid 1,2-hydratase [Salinarimonas sp.]|uniref:carotenoid 1,2-hydratase n=1 Tax=Salinarimonas sp. TaxID=2766526 RepID=UPI0032D9030C
MDGRASDLPRFRFDRTVPDDGYCWWYVDVLSDDGKLGLTIIAFIGNVFSPYYAWARRKGPADPHAFPAMNVVLYGHGHKRWALTERRRDALSRDATSLAIGPSQMRWEGDALVVEFDERTMPVPGRIKGSVRLTPSGETPQIFALDAGGRHMWWPIAPASRAQVTLEHPNVSFSGDAYFDMNFGARPLEADFDWWNWSRAPTSRGACVLYDVIRLDGSRQVLALDIGRDGSVRDVDTPPLAPLPPGTIWRMPRETRADAGGAPKVLKTFEDTPFYTRSEIATRLLGEDVRAMHESLSMPQFTKRWVQMLLPFRMPRRFV